MPHNLKFWETLVSKMQIFKYNVSNSRKLRATYINFLSLVSLKYVLMFTLWLNMKFGVSNQQWGLYPFHYMWHIFTSVSSSFVRYILNRWLFLHQSYLNKLFCKQTTQTLFSNEPTWTNTSNKLNWGICSRGAFHGRR